MQGLGETIARLRGEKRSFAQSPGDGRSPRLSETRTFGADPGALRMLTYVPAGLPPSAPLVVVLHGCTQTAESHAAASGWLSLADQHGFAVLAPEQRATNNPNRCFNWFESGDTRAGQGEVASIRSMIAHCLAVHDLDASDVYVTGLSAGGAMAVALMAAYPQVFSGGAVVAGLPFGVANGVQEAMTAMHRPAGLAPAPGSAPLPRISIWHGSADMTVHPRNAELIAQQWLDSLGLSGASTSLEAEPGRSRSVWRDTAGRAQVELNLIAGLGHGVPISVEDGVGFPAPYVLEAGVSSSLEIARFWGLVPEGARPVPRVRPAPTHGPAETGRAATPPLLGIGEGAMAALSGHVPDNVRATIERALKSAGLLS